jgi:putative ABC transport system substrate-binding protein
MLRKFFLACLLASILSPADGAQRSPYRITMVLFRGCEDACKGFVDYWATHKIPVVIEMLDADTDVKKLPGFVAQVKARKPDLLVTWGTTVALAMLGQYDAVEVQTHVTGIPALFMIASTPVGSKLVPTLKSSGRNISGTSYLVPVATQLRAAKLYIPFNPAEDNSSVTRAELVAASKQEGFELIERVVPKGADGTPDKLSLPRLVHELAEQKADLLYMAPDTFLLLNRDAITSAAMQSGLPVLASAELAVRESNALMGVVNRYYTIGQLTAWQSERILVDGVAPQQIPIEAPPNFSLIVNMRVANAMKLYPPMRVLKIAEVVR